MAKQNNGSREAMLFLKKSQPTILEGHYSVRDGKFFPTIVIA